MKRLIGLVLWLCSGFCFGQAADTLFVSCSQTVHLRFASELKYVGLGSQVLLARIVDGSRDYVAVKAREAFAGCTSLSCLEAGGAMHSFVVAYREEPGRLVVDVAAGGSVAGGAGIGGSGVGAGGAGSFGAGAGGSGVGADAAGSGVGADAAGSFGSGFGAGGAGSGFGAGAAGVVAGGAGSDVVCEEILAMRQGVFHIGASAYGIEVLCENLLVADDVLYMLVSVRNRSAMSYAVSEPRFVVESARFSRRRGLQVERALFPREVRALGTVPPGGYGRMVYAFDKLALVRGQVLRVYLYEAGGARNMVLEVGRKDLEGVRRVE